MRILFDQGTPEPLRDALAAHSVATAYEQGWSKLDNGDLLAAAERDGFGVFITTDKNLGYQQNLRGRRIAILVLPTTQWPVIRLHTAEVAAAIVTLGTGEYRELNW